MLSECITSVIATLLVVAVALFVSALTLGMTHGVAAGPGAIAAMILL
jgi:hypothetical protein